jgi:hypothetical protein
MVRVCEVALVVVVVCVLGGARGGALNDRPILGEFQQSVLYLQAIPSLVRNPKRQYSLYGV